MSRSIVPLVLLGLAACSVLYPVRVENTGAPPAPPRPIEHVEVLAETPSRPFVEIARLATDSVNYDDPSHAVERLRRIAAEKGADAIIVERRGSRLASVGNSAISTAIDFGTAPTSGDPSVYGASGGTVSSFARVVAIRWITPDGERPLDPSVSSAPVRPADAPFFTPASESRPRS
ncbi:MAG TPA: hypothetical protein VKE69_05940 [Planctomycetota bacterium]|nr:hypothetical protein [Planctomycetota bacterium]